MTRFPQHLATTTAVFGALLLAPVADAKPASQKTEQKVEKTANAARTS